jgi:hypothetical protein
MATRYDEVYGRWQSDPQGFWAEAACSIHWDRKWDEVLDSSQPPFHRWFRGGLLNTCYNALDRHVAAGRAEQPALIYDSPVTGQCRSYTYSELREEVARFAGVLALDFQFGLCGIRDHNCQHFLVNIDSCYVVYRFHALFLRHEAENARKTSHAPSRATDTEAGAHSLVQPCVPDQTPPRPQHIQCDNDHCRSMPGPILRLIENIFMPIGGPKRLVGRNGP